jgi:hypothetical protein
MAQTTINTSANSIDELGVLLAQIADLTKRAEAIKDGLKDEATANGVKVFEGSLFKATFVESNRAVVDYKSLIKDHDLEGIVCEYTKTTAVFSIKTTAR